MSIIDFIYNFINRNNENYYIEKIKQSNKIPQHIAFIMDGNGRWALKQHKQRSYGHQHATKYVIDIIKGCHEIGVKYMSFFLFSFENWKRPEKEIDTIFKTICDFIDNNISECIAQKICVRILGDICQLPKTLYEKLVNLVEKTKNFTNIYVNLCINYSGKWDILYSIKNLINKGIYNLSNIKITDLDNFFRSTNPDPDVIIRTGGDQRLSNFFLWQASYSELFFEKKQWPDFNSIDLYKILLKYQDRKRRYGGLVDY